MRRRKGIPFAEDIIGTWRGPEVFAYGRTFKTAFSGGRHASRSLGSLEDASSVLLIGGARIRARGS